MAKVSQGDEPKKGAPKPFANLVTGLLIVASVLWFASEPSEATSIGPPRSFELIAGKDDEYRLVMLMSREPLYTDDGKAYPVSGLYPNDGSISPLWQIEQLEPPLRITDDGRYLASIAGYTFERDAVAIRFYDRGKLISEVKVSDFIAPAEATRPTTAGFAWNLEIAFDSKRGLLRITTLRRKRQYYSMSSGQRVEAPAATD